MKKILFLATILILFLTGCEEPHEITVYHPGDEIDKNIVFDQMIKNGPIVEFHMIISSDEEKNLDSIFEIINIEFEYEQIGYGYGSSFDEELLHGTNYQLILNDTELTSLSNVELVSGVSYSFVVRFDFTGDATLANARELEKVFLNLIVDENTVLLTESD